MKNNSSQHTPPKTATTIKPAIPYIMLWLSSLIKQKGDRLKTPQKRNKRNEKNNKQLNQCHNFKNIVTYRPVAKRRICNQRPLLGNGHNNRGSVFSVGPCRGIISGTKSGAYPPSRGASTVTLRVVEGDEMGSHRSGRESQGTRIWERLRWQGLAAYTKDRPVLSSEGAPQKQDSNCETLINIWS
jgi:hypothetical protein